MNAVVTGAARGLGFAVAEAFIAHGASVLVADLHPGAVSEAAERLSTTGAARGLRCDVTSADDVEAMVQECVTEFGSIDILVNNAGVTKDGYITKLNESDFDLVLGVSLKGAWLATRAAAPHLRAQKSGSIINMSSLSGKIGNPGQTNYSAAKAGLVGLTKAAAKELGPSGVRVNAIQPGLIRTDMTLAMKPEVFAAKEAEVPMGRAGLPDEVAGACVFLSSALASYVNGAVLEVTGGRGL